MAASSACAPIPSETTDWKQKLREELLSEVKGQMVELSKSLVEELRRGWPSDMPRARDRSYSDGNREQGRRPARPAEPRYQWDDQGLPATVGQVAGTPFRDPLPVPIPGDEWVGHCPEVEIQVNGVKINCLVDTGSQVTLFTESLSRELFKDHRLQGAEASRLTLRGANGLDIPYTGYVVVDFDIRGIPVYQKGVVIVKDHCLGTRRALLGMNVIADCWEELFRNGPARRPSREDNSQWENILKDCHRIHAAGDREDRESVGRVVCRYALSVPAGSEAVVWARVPASSYGPEDLVLVEPHWDCQAIDVARGLAVVHHGRVIVRVRNTNPYPIMLRRHQCLARITSVSPQQVREDSDVCFVQVSAAVVEVTIRSDDVKADLSENGVPEHLVGDSLRGEGLEEEQQYQLREFLSKWQHVFSTHDEDYGCTGVVKHQIPTGNAAPSRERYRPVPPTLYSEIRTLLKGMLDKGIIRESSSPWAAPVVLVQKKTGAWRFCVDYRKLNSVTKKDAFPLPRIEDSLTSLTQAAWYSTLDLASGYWQVQVEGRDQEKTAFTTPFGLFEWDRMPFGLCNAPATFQRLMQRCLGGQLVDNTLVYLDDVIVFSPDFASHLLHLEQVFQAMERYGLKLRPDKCQLFRKEVKFLGHCVSTAGVAPDPEKVLAVQNWEAPQTVRQVRSFLGFVGYYRRFIKGFSAIAKPLNQLLSGTGRFRGRGSPSVDWRPECEEAFQTLKQELLQAPILAYADFSLPFILYTDASHAGLGAVLAQRQQGVERATSQGRELSNAASIIRRGGRFVGGSGGSPWIPLGRGSPSWGWDPNRWKTLQGKDESLKKISSYLKSGVGPGVRERQTQTSVVKRLLGQWKRLGLREGVLCRSVQDRATREIIRQVIVPEEQVVPLLTAYHTHMGHQGQERTLSLLRRYFYWGGMETTVGTFIQSCPRCVLFKSRKEKKAPLVPMRPRAPLHIVGMDYLTLGRPTDRFQNILVVTDLFTKFAWATPTLDQTAATTASALWRMVIQPFGCPEILHSDQGPNFESRVIQELSQLYGCRKTRTTSYHPQGNGGCERFNQTLLSLLGTLETDHQVQWTECLPALLQAYNNSVHSITGYAPAFLMFGRHMRLPVDLLLGTEPTEGAQSTTEWVGRHHQQLYHAYRRVTEHLNTAAAKNKRLYDRTARDAPLLPGERVLVRDNRRQGKGKLSDRWESTPYVVERQQGPDMPVYTVRPEGRLGPERVLHRNLLRPCPNFPEGREETPVVPPCSEAPWVGWAVAPRHPEVGVGRVAPVSPPRRSQRDTRGQPPERYGAWVEDAWF
ncbi:interleukin-1 receptor accessory protein-like 1-A [Pimephales promelas]|nr:interleukin-1 receptor accessory protein-like 1-A [Pimephales promelas]